MSASNSTVTPNNIILTPMRVTFTAPGGSPVDLGGTTEGVTLSVKTAHADIMVDQFGKTAINSIVSGHAFSVKLTLAEVANKSNWLQAFPHFNLVTNGMGQTIFIFNMAVGDSLLQYAGLLNLHPLSKPNSDLSEDINISLAACKSASDLKFTPDKQVGLAVEFEVFPNTAVQPARFMTFGDPTISPTNAAAGSPTESGNTGNGTVTSVVAFSGFTVTETMTLLCIGKDTTYGTIFSVVGSLSGNLGQVIVAPSSGSTANFSNPKIAFTMTQGSTEWAHGDSWTIAMTAANYV